MEILSEHTEWWTFILFGSVIGVFTLFLVLALIGGIVSVIQDGDDGSDVAGIIVVTALIVLLGFGIITMYNEGPTVYYKAIVTDYNEVYDGGYTVIGTEGKIVTLTKEAK